MEANVVTLDENTDAKDAEIVLDEIVIEDNNIQKEPEISSTPALEVNPPQAEDFHLIKEENEMPAPKYQDKTDIEIIPAGLILQQFLLKNLRLKVKKRYKMKI